MTINIIYRGVESTPAIKDYLEEKMMSLTKYDDRIQHIDIEIGVTTHHHKKGDIFFCKAGVSSHGDVLRLEREEDDLYKAIDKVRDHLRVELSERKERRQDRAQQVESEEQDPTI